MSKKHLPLPVSSNEHGEIMRMQYLNSYIIINIALVIILTVLQNYRLQVLLVLETGCIYYCLKKINRITSVMMSILYLINTVSFAVSISVALVVDIVGIPYTIINVILFFMQVSMDSQFISKIWTITFINLITSFIFARTSLILVAGNNWYSTIHDKDDIRWFMLKIANFISNTRHAIVSQGPVSKMANRKRDSVDELADV